jgi:hypothetical protein
MVDELKKLSDVGFDGIVLSWFDYLQGLERWNREVMPRLVQAGLRRPVQPITGKAAAA